MGSCVSIIKTHNYFSDRQPVYKRVNGNEPKFVASALISTFMVFAIDGRTDIAMSAGLGAASLSMLAAYGKNMVRERVYNNKHLA